MTDDQKLAAQMRAAAEGLRTVRKVLSRHLLEAGPEVMPHLRLVLVEGLDVIGALEVLAGQLGDPTP
jgi:hypothetical protein